MNLIADQLRLALTAVQYFTRVPVPRWVGYSERRLNEAARYFTLVGVLVGLATGLAYLLALAVFTQAIAVLLAMLAGILLTGGFHEDGLADACDGFGGGWDKSQVLAIMKDSRIGTYGALGLVSVLALKFAALDAIPAERFLAVAIAAHAFSRFMAVSVIATQRYVREDEGARARPVAQGLSATGIACAALFALAPLPWLGPAGIAGAAGALALRFAAARYFHRRIGGYTGDCLGAIQQVTEVGFYLAVVAWVAWSSWTST
jgi:adenosylcobinamide-GDP ribazoletransferase